MSRDLSAVFVVLMCVYTFKVHARCPAGFDLNSFAKPPSHDSKKTKEEVLMEKLRFNVVLTFEFEDNMGRVTIQIKAAEQPRSQGPLSYRNDPMAEEIGPWERVPLTDVDGDNKTSVEELAAWTEKSLQSVHKQEAKARVKVLDTNKDGKVTWEEYLQSEEDIGASTEEQKRRRFNHADEDKDGWLTKDEIISMFHPEEKPHMFDVVADEYLEMGDSNKDGFLSLDEYKKKLMKGKANKQVAKTFFTQQDKDQDEKISKDEIKLWIASISSSSQAKQQAKQLVDIADDNKDGFLNEEEILNHVDLFAGKRENKGQQTEKTVKDEL